MPAQSDIERGFAAFLKLSVKDEASGKVSNPDLENEDLDAVRPILNQCAECLEEAISYRSIECIVMAGRIGFKHPSIIQALQHWQQSRDMNGKLNAICSLLFLEGIELDEQGKIELVEMCLVEMSKEGGEREAAGRCLRVLAIGHTQGLAELPKEKNPFEYEE